MTRILWGVVGWLLLVAVLPPASAGEFDHGLLWQVERNGQVSWLFGTLHNDDARVTYLPEPVAAAFARARSLVLEIDPEAARRDAAAAMRFADGRDLARVADPGLYREASDAMLARGVPREETRALKPWAVALMLSMPRRSSGDFLDRVLYRKGVSEAGLPFHPLETAQEQLALFDTLAREEQLALLRDTVTLLDRLPGLLDRLTRAYLDRDLAAVMALSKEIEPGDPALAERLDRELITERNFRMTARMIIHLREGGAFVAVGAVHLYGEQGIPSLLAKRGYRVTRLY
ncbi:TraB/GumN family protein [Endothiovibrio diazotrophicus]